MLDILKCGFLLMAVVCSMILVFCFYTDRKIPWTAFVLQVIGYTMTLFLGYWF